MHRAVDLLAEWAAGWTSDAADQVAGLITTVLGGDTAVQRLLAEAAEGSVTDRTRQRAALALEDYAERVPSFARELDAALHTAGTENRAVNAFAPIQLSTRSALSSATDAVIAEDVDVVERLFFGRDDAEHDMADGLLREGFIQTKAFSEVLSGRKNLIIGRKGSGKSAICMRLSMGGLNPGETCLITPDETSGEELRRFALGGLTGSAAKALLWRYLIAVHAARYLVQHAGGAGHRRRRTSSVVALQRFLRDNGELADENLYHRIVRAGRGLMSSLSLDAFGVKIALGTNTAPEAVRASRQLEVVETGVQNAFTDLGCAEEHGALLVVVDQLEQVWSGEPESEALVTGLLLAGKHVALAYKKSLRCALFMRSDIYDGLEFSDADKFHSDEIRISWTARELHQLAITRASVALGRQLEPSELWGEVFPTTVHGEPTADYLFARSLPRPRDAIQFLNQCRDTAFGNGHHRILETDVLEATLVFSRWKVLDLAKEYGVRFPFLDGLLTVFRDAGYELTRTSFAEMFLPFRDLLVQRHRQYADLFDPDAVIDLLFSVGFLGVRRHDGYA
ncbi:hypothetical protein F0L68_05450 [Solihabitans fulvus]|uniref:Uncharacterized protein n=1 Tax=Solihabitans fulvus TaxID=1892852 RepID=A0A5B2XP21_9PSEU|nr:hypothetical protein [Solihabitans fulvus]KAA2265106.1 hypothetical protein F0L68_05450 [Solihabitans fulvus]